jgi:hypothetical protein
MRKDNATGEYRVDKGRVPARSRAKLSDAPPAKSMYWLHGCLANKTSYVRCREPTTAAQRDAQLTGLPGRAVSFTLRPTYTRRRASSNNFIAEIAGPQIRSMRLGEHQVILNSQDIISNDQDILQQQEICRQDAERQTPQTANGVRSKQKKHKTRVGETKPDRNGLTNGPNPW